MLIPTLDTRRLRLRGLRHSDIDAYAEMVADPDVARYLGDGQPLSREGAWRSMATMIGHWELRGYGMWAVDDRDSGEMVGRVGCWQPECWPDFEIGWTLRRQFWGRGYATEAARAALDWAFGVLKRDHVISLIRPANERSQRVALRIGERLGGEVELHGAPALVYRLERGDHVLDHGLEPAAP